MDTDPDDTVSHRRLLAGAGVLAAALVAVAAAPSVAPSWQRWRETPDATLARLPVAAEDRAAPYDRAAFGQPWKDTDRNGCDQRNDVLARDLTNVVKAGSCVVVAGDLRDPYTGLVVHFTKADAGAVQIDHLVPLEEANQSGAASWTPEQRLALATDPANLQATIGWVNEGKGARDPGSDDGNTARRWPPAGDLSSRHPGVRFNLAYRCEYARRWDAVKDEYHLSIDPAERDGLAALLHTC